MDSIKLDVSIGEAVDKMSILAIKLAKVDEVKRKEVLKECNTIQPQLQRYIDNHNYQYQLLIKINEEIWDLQDIFRDKYKINPKDNMLSELAILIIEKNDQRFRIKNKINILCQSVLKEQKGYKDKRLLLFPHTGMGDQLTVMGAVRQLSLEYEEIKIVVLRQFVDSVKFMYRDDPTITFLPINSIYDFSPNFGNNSECIKKYTDVGYIYKGCFMHKEGFDHNYNIPVPFYKVFYSDLDLEYDECRWKFSLNRDLQREQEFYEEVSPKNKYIFVHDNADNAKNSAIYGSLDIISDFEIFHPNKIDKKSNVIMDYGVIIENAEELHILDSAFYCLCNYLDLSKVKKKVVYARCETLDGYLQQTDWEIMPYK